VVAVIIDLSKEMENKMNEKFCVACGFILETDLDLASMCFSCSAFSTKSLEFLTTWVPATCGNDDCFTDKQGIPNLDGDNCSHAYEFESVLDNF
jgi:hypothetical protein